MCGHYARVEAPMYLCTGVHFNYMSFWGYLYLNKNLSLLLSFSELSLLCGSRCELMTKNKLSRNEFMTSYVYIGTRVCVCVYRCFDNMINWSGLIRELLVTLSFGFASLAIWTRVCGCEKMRDLSLRRENKQIRDLQWAREINFMNKIVPFW